MKQLLSLLLGILLISAAEAQMVSGKSLLWKVSGKGLTEPSYLYGTFHLMCPADLQVSPVIEDKLKLSKKLFLEMDMDDTSVLRKVQEAVLMPDSSWKGLLSEQQFAAFSTNFEKITGIPGELVVKVKPFGLISVVLMKMMKCELASWDLTLAQKARENHMDVLGLETPERELEAIDALSLKEQADMLAEMVGNADSTLKSMHAMIDIYKQKDLDSMQAVMTSDKRYGIIEEELLVKRNKEWAPEIIRQATLEPTFFAFGAGHLGGENGVINLLKREGYKVTAVFY